MGKWKKLVQKPLMETKKGQFLEKNERLRPTAWCFGVMFTGDRRYDKQSFKIIPNEDML